MTHAQAERLANRAGAAAKRAEDAFKHFQTEVHRFANDNCECAEAVDGIRSATCTFHERAAAIKRVLAHIDDPVGTQDLARLLYSVAEWPSMGVAMGQAVLREKPSGRRAQRALLRLTDLGLLVRWKSGQVYRYRVTKAGMKVVAKFDRSDRDRLWQRILMERWEAVGRRKSLEHESMKPKHALRFSRVRGRRPHDAVRCCRLSGGQRLARMG